MKKPQKPMMLAYIGFLCICIIYYLICYTFGFEFAVGKRIVAAATIASYFFTLASMDKLIMKQETMNAEFFTKELRLLQKIREKEQKLVDDVQIKQDLRSSMDDWISELTGFAESAHKAIRKHERNAFWNDVLGFLLFFCIVAFDFLYAIFENTQEIYTLAAFAGVVAIEYIETTIMAQHEEKRRNTAESIQNMYTRLEEVDNG